MKRTRPTQLSLFGQVVRCPICIREKHCGWKATLGPPRDVGGCINRAIVCLHCGATGEQSTRKAGAS